MTTPFERVLDALESHDLRVSRNGVKAEAQCPAHDDRNASLSVGIGDDGRALLHCHAGCETADILAALGRAPRDLFPENGNSGSDGHREILDTYSYVDEDEQLLYQVVRFKPKDFRQRRPDGHGGWIWSLNGTRRVLYRLPDVIAAVKANRPVYIAEGEKDVHAIEHDGQVATCNPGGAGKWRAEYTEMLRGAKVAIIADRDEPGRQHARTVARSLEGVADLVKVAEPAAGKDAADHLAAGLGLHELVPVDTSTLEDAAAAGNGTADDGVTSNAETPAASEFFDGKTFVGPRLAEWLRKRSPTAIGGRQLYAWDGTYRPCEDHFRRRVAAILGPDWKANRAEEIISYLRQSSDEMWEAPPRDRVAVANGILTIRGRELTPATPDYRSPVRLAAAYDPAARCPANERFLGEVFPGGADLWYEVIGHLMIPENRQRAIMLLGAGGNGKSTALRVVKEFLGGQNVSAVGLHQLEENRFAAADLYGKLANICADLDARALDSSGVFKAITGGDPIRAERKHRDPFEFIAYARLLFSANQPPPTSDSSQAFFDRWIVVPFDARIRGTNAERQQDDLLAELTSPTELAGLLNHALDGLDRLRSTGRFTTTDATERAAENFRASTDSVAGFLHEHTTTNPEARTAHADLWHAYRAWCEENNRRPLSAQRFHGRTRELARDQGANLDEVKVNGARTYIGIRLERP